MATKTKKAPVDELTLTGYCMKTKEKGVALTDAVIDVVGNKYIAKGHDGNENKITTIVSKTKAEECISAGLAKRGAGWGKAAKK